MKNRRRLRGRFPAAKAPAERLENRVLLAGVVDSIQIDNQAPVVLPDVNGSELLALSDSDSTRLFTTDGTQGGTAEYADIPVRFTEDTSGSVVVGNNLFFAAMGADGAELWKTDGTGSGTALVQRGIDSSFDDFAILNGEVIFAADADRTIGSELYKSDGGPATLVLDVNPGHRSKSVYMGPNRSAHLELWINEIDENDKSLIRSRVIHETNVPNDGSSYRDVVVPRGRYRYWVRPTDANGVQGDWSPGREFSTSARPYDSQPTEFTVFDNAVFFAAETRETGRELWKTDGTSGGTIQVADIDMNTFRNGSHPGSMVEFNGSLYFSVGKYAVDPLYRTDGTEVGTVKVGQVAERTVPVGVANGHLFAVQYVNDELRLVSFSAVIDASPEVLHTIPEHVGGSDHYWSNSLKSFAIVDSKLHFLSVEFESAKSAGLSPSDDRHLPSSVPRTFLTKVGTWYSTDGTAAGTRMVPGDTVILSENNVIQSFTNTSLNSVQRLGDFHILDTFGTWQLTAEEIKRLSFFGPTETGDAVFAPGSSDSVVSIDSSGQAEELNVEFQNIQSVDELSGAAWVTADSGDGTALLKLDISVNNVAGPIIDGPAEQAVLPSGDVEFRWHTTDSVVNYDAILRQVSYDYDAIARPRLSLENTQLTSLSEDLSTERYRFQVRSNFADGTSSRWSQHVVTISAPTAAGPRVLSPREGDHFFGQHAVTWETDTHAASYDIRVNGSVLSEPTVRGITETTALILPKTGDNSFFVRSRFADGSVSQWSQSENFRATPPFQITSVTPDTAPREYAVRVALESVSRNGRYELFDEASGERVAAKEAFVVLARTGSVIMAISRDRTIEVPYTGRFHLQMVNTGTYSEQNTGLKSEPTSVVFDAVVPFAESRPAVVDAVDDGTNLNLYWAALDDAVSYEVEIEGVTTFTNLTGTHLRLDRPGEAADYRALVTAIDAAGQRSLQASGSFTKQRGTIELTAGDGPQTTSQPTIQWATPSPRFPDVASYEVLLVSDSGAAPYRQTGIPTTRHQISTPLTNGKWKIYVRAHFTDNSNSDWALPAGEMQVATPNRTSPNITSPDRTTTSVRPILEWEPNLAASHYEVWLSSSNAITPVIHDNNVSENRLIPMEDLSLGSYRLWVRTHYPDGSSTRWTPAHRFDILSNDIVRITGGVGTQPAGDHSIIWTAVPDAVRYEMYVNVTGRRSEAVYHSVDLSGTAHTIPVNLPGNQIYEIWMRAHFPNGQRTRWGATPEQLWVQVDLSNTKPSLILDGSNASWAEIAGAARYELWVDEVDPNNHKRRIRLRAFWIRTDTTSVDMGLSSGTYRIWLNALAADNRRSQWTEPQILTIP